MSSYDKHAEVWDWAGYDRTEEFEFWYKLAKTYGNDTLSLMCALGEVGAYLAKRGQRVTALDLSQAMILEGKKRFCDVNNLRFVKGDICNFDLHQTYDFAFIGSTDLHHLHSVEQLECALSNIKKHLKPKGGFALELWHPSEKSWESPKRRFDQFKQDSDIKVWKEGTTKYDAITKKVFINQIVFIEKDNKVESFDHCFELQLYDREVLLKLINQSGFSIVSEYGDYQFEPWNETSSKWLIELISR